MNIFKGAEYIENQHGVRYIIKVELNDGIKPSDVPCQYMYNMDDNTIKVDRDYLYHISSSLNDFLYNRENIGGDVTELLNE